MSTRTATRPCRAVVADALAAYPPGLRGATGVVVLLLDDEQRPTGRTLIRAPDPGLTVASRESLLREALHVLRHGHSSGATASQCLVLCCGVRADTPVWEQWWAGLRGACAAADLHPLDVVPVPPSPPAPGPRVGVPQGESRSAR